MPNNDGSLNMGPYEPVQEIEDPQNNEEVYLGSFNSIIQHNLGTYVACEFLIGANNLERREGILYSGGNNYVTLYQPSDEAYIVCDLFSLKFLTFYDTRKRPRGGISGIPNPRRFINSTPPANGSGSPRTAWQ